MTIHAAKHHTRLRLNAVLNELSPDAISQKSALIADRLFATGWWNEADTILAFCSMPREVDTSVLIARAFEQVKTVGIPRIRDNDLIFHRLRRPDAACAVGVFGIREPWPDWPVLDIRALRIGKLLIITPGLAFDRRLNRLGRGKGFYDRFLRMARACDPENIRAIGVCFSEQLIDAVPIDDHDAPVDGIMTDCQTLRP